MVIHCHTHATHGNTVIQLLRINKSLLQLLPLLQHKLLHNYCCQCPTRHPHNERGDRATEIQRRDSIEEVGQGGGGMEGAGSPKEVGFK